MCLNYLKEVITKKSLLKRLSNVSHLATDKKIETVGIIFDETYFYEKEDLVNELILKGIQEENIQFVVFKNKLKKNEVFDYPVFSYNDFSWNSAITKKEIIDFTNEKFDLLINYYDTEKTALMLVSYLSKASFKVGFSSVDKRLNHFMINTNAENYKVFIDELFKYLKILNKI